MKKEQSFHSKLIKWIQYNKHKLPDNFLIETKVARDGKRFPLKELSEKERVFLRQASSKGIVATNSDYGGLGTICDGYCLKGEGLVFLQFVRRGNKQFYILDINNIEDYEHETGAKSVTEEDCMDIVGCRVCELK